MWPCRDSTRRAATLAFEAEAAEAGADKLRAGAGGSIDQLTVTCKGAYSRVLGLLRLGGKTGRASRALSRLDFVGLAAD